jgi:hypothetical protein
MVTIDLILRSTPFPLSVQRKSTEEAEDTYREILEAMRSGTPEILEMTASDERGNEKKVAIRVSEISGIQLSQKGSTAAGSGRPPGFFALTE